MTANCLYADAAFMSFYPDSTEDGRLGAWSDTLRDGARRSPFRPDPTIRPHERHCLTQSTHPISSCQKSQIRQGEVSTFIKPSF